MTTASDTSALPARQRPSVGLLLANAASLALVVWIGVDHTSLGLEVRGARVVALSAMPLWPLYALSVAAAAGLGLRVRIPRLAVNTDFRLLTRILRNFLKLAASWPSTSAASAPASDAVNS